MQRREAVQAFLGSVVSIKQQTGGARSRCFPRGGLVWSRRGSRREHVAHLMTYIAQRSLNTCVSPTNNCHTQSFISQHRALANASILALRDDDF
jgi:hypothetical protein